MNHLPINANLKVSRLLTYANERTRRSGAEIFRTSRHGKRWTLETPLSFMWIQYRPEEFCEDHEPTVAAEIIFDNPLAAKVQRIGLDPLNKQWDVNNLDYRGIDKLIKKFNTITYE